MTDIVQTAPNNKAVINALRAIADGLRPKCPICNGNVKYDPKQTGKSGAQGYNYRCEDSKCPFVGFVKIPWHTIILAAIQKKTLQIALTGIASITLTGLVAFATGVFKVPGTSSNLDQILKQQIEKAESPFQRSQLERIRRQLNELINQKHLDFFDGPGNAFAMAAAADLTHRSIQAIALFAPDAYHKELTPYMAANKKALERGVLIKRLFIIPEDSSDNDVEAYVKAMTEQLAEGFKIYYAFQTEVELFPLYQIGPIYPCALFDDSFLGYDVRTDILRKGFPDISRFTWDSAEIQEKCPFPALWTFHAVRQFDAASASAVREHFSQLHK